jgi:hypothetical protein
VRMSEEELVELVQRIMDCDGPEEEVDRMMNLLEANVPHPEVSDLIFWNKDGDLTAEEVVRRALAYKPFLLPPSSMVMKNEEEGS